MDFPMFKVNTSIVQWRGILTMQISNMMMTMILNWISGLIKNNEKQVEVETNWKQDKRFFDIISNTNLLNLLHSLWTTPKKSLLKEIPKQIVQLNSTRQIQHLHIWQQTESQINHTISLIYNCVSNGSNRSRQRYKSNNSILHNQSKEIPRAYCSPVWE